MSSWRPPTVWPKIRPKFEILFRSRFILEKAKKKQQQKYVKTQIILFFLSLFSSLFYEKNKNHWPRPNDGLQSWNLKNLGGLLFAALSITCFKIFRRCDGSCQWVCAPLQIPLLKPPLPHCTTMLPNILTCTPTVFGK